MEVKTFLTKGGGLENQCYLLTERGQGVLIDPAWDFGLIDGYIKQGGIALQAVLLTHAHPDHTDLAATFALQYGVPVYMSSEETAFYGFSCYGLEEVEDGESIRAGLFHIKAILTPGHTKGGMSYLAEKHLFSGDTFFIEGVGLCNGLGGDALALYRSVQRIKSLPADTLFWPGHSYGQAPGKPLSFLMDNNLYFQLGEEHFVNFRNRGS